MEQRAYSYIRFSTPEQATGDSLKRQVEASQKYCEEKGYVLDNSLKLTDRGLSAYKGTHRTKGALGKFLKLVEDGQIPPGSILIVENFDRLSREQVLDALNQFTGIIRAGIKLVTLQDGMEYCQDSINQNWTQLIISIVYMARAHEESEAKSKRLFSAWEHKRQNGNNRKLTAKCPDWVRLSKDRTKFILIPEAAKAVETIYRMKLAGKGGTRIEKELIADPDIWKPEKGWSKSYIMKILNTKAVIGEFQPRKKGEPVGEPIPDYFPPAISEDLYYQVQAVIKANAAVNGRAGGRTGKAGNLFVHIVKCGLCHSSMHFIDKGKPPKGGKYLHCDKSRRLRECPAKAIRYDEFERIFFDNFEELDISQLMPGEDETQLNINDLERRLTTNQQRIYELNEEIENLTESIGRTKDNRVREQLEGRLSWAFNERENLEAKSQEHEQEITELKQQRGAYTQDIEQAKEIYQLLETAQTEEERINLRFRLRQQIQRLIEWVKVYPLEEPYQQIQEIEEPGIVKIMKSRYIDKVRIKFKGSRDFRVLYLKNHAEQV